jgi:hypothetical protein
VVVDVGANGGDDYSIPAVKDCQHIVFAFEPVDIAIEKFRHNVKEAGISDRFTEIDVTPGEMVNLELIRVGTELSMHVVSIISHWPPQPIMFSSSPETLWFVGVRMPRWTDPGATSS